jgi:hypothetical protein
LISAKHFASLGSVWHISVPSLEQLTRWVNSTTKKYTLPVTREGESSRSSLIAETAFERLVTKFGPARDPETTARAFLNKLPGAPEGGPLSAKEKHEVFLIARNLETFLPDSVWRDCQFHPLFPGCGYVDSAVGDALVDGQLIEVKSVERGFRGIDFRQALTYSALAYAADIQVDRISLVNPRRAVYFRSDVSTLARDLGAASWIDLMQNLVNAMTDVNPSQ